METKISNFHISFYIPEIQKMMFHNPYVQIMGTSHCGDSFRTTFKLRESFQYVLFCHVYAERVVASFPHQIQSEYYSVSISVSIEGIALEHFSTLPNSVINSFTKSCTRHALFNYFSF